MEKQIVKLALILYNGGRPVPVYQEGVNIVNPALPRCHFVPDGEAREMPDGRLYVYGSYDRSGAEEYCSDVLHAFSTDDMVHWTDHGVIFRCSDIPWAEPGGKLFAPDCIHRDGKYYLYFCLSNDAEGVAVADHPWGPFTDPKPIDIANGDGIDPAIFVDDDGQAYYYWGQYSLRAARMNSDMHTLDAASINRALIDEKRHGFHEGASVRKRNGLYYLVFSDITRGRPTCLGYAVSTNPLGPFEYKGIIIDNTGCDPETWNNHGSIALYKGEWYVFYHRSSQRSRYSRRLCIEPIHFEADGSIPEVLPTTQGTEGPLQPGLIAAADACRLAGNGSKSHIRPDLRCPGEEVIAVESEKGWAAWRYVRFDQSISEAVLEAEAEGCGTVKIWADDDCIGEIAIQPTSGNREQFSCPVSKVCGVKTLYLEWAMEEDCPMLLKSICLR